MTGIPGGTGKDTAMGTSLLPHALPAREIERRGISAVDEHLAQGPVHIIKDDRPAYVVMTEERYAELLESERQEGLLRVREAEAEYRAGKAKPMSADDLLATLDAPDPA